VAGGAGERGFDRVRDRVRSAGTSVRLVADAVQAALRALEAESVRLRAMALTYISLFALVPALLVAFSVVQAFTGMDRIAGLVHEFLFENLAVGARETVEPYLQRFVANAHATSAGLVGGALLVWSAVSLFSNVEAALNDIWGVGRRRSRTQQAVIYWVGLTLGPLLLAGSVTLAGYARNLLAGTGIKALAAGAGAVLTCTFFTLLYVIVPYTKVKVRAALLGGVAAGLVWEGAKWGYALAVARLFKYHAIYGSVAAVPIFIFWLFLSWTVLLFGARLAYVVQYAAALRERGPRGTSRSIREILAGQALLVISRAFDRMELPPDPGDVAARLGASAEEAGEALSALRRAGLVISVADGGLLPARPLERLTLLDVRRAVLGGDPEGRSGRGGIPEIIKEIEEQAGERLAAVTFRSLCEPERSTPTEGAPADVGTEGGRPRAAPGG
jgi:membrane protein